MRASPDNMVEIDGEFYAKNHPKALAHRQDKPVAGLRSKEPESDQRGKGQDRRVETSAGGIQYRVAFTVYRKRLLDGGDNDRSALKATRDSVADFLGFASDNDPRLIWEYHQIKASRDLGTHVLICAEV